MFTESNDYNGMVAKKVDAPVAITLTMEQAQKLLGELLVLDNDAQLDATMALDDLRLVLDEVLNPIPTA